MNAIILAGGRGTRLAPWHTAKTLMPIGGISILLRLIDHLVVYQDILRRVVIATGYRAGDIEAAVDRSVYRTWHTDEYDHESYVMFSDAGEDVPMGARLLKAREQVRSERVLILYSDELADVNIAALLKKHEGGWMTFAAATAKTTGGTVVDNRRSEIEKYREPRDDDEENEMIRIIDEEARWVNIGFVVVEPQCWALLKPEDGLSDWINRVSEEHGRVRVYYHEGKRATVNTLADLEYAEKIWR